MRKPAAHACFTCLLLLAAALLLALLPAVAQIDISEASRDRWQQPQRIMDSVGVRAGMVVGEAGAGTGYFAFKLARRVGPAGLVLANDINENRLREIEGRCRREQVANIRTIHGSETEAKFPGSGLDMIFLVYVLHDLKKPVPFLESLAPALKPGAPLVIVDQDPEKTGSRSGHFWKADKVQKTVTAAGFVLLRIDTFLARDNIYIFRRAGI